MLLQGSSAGYLVAMLCWDSEFSFSSCAFLRWNSGPCACSASMLSLRHIPVFCFFKKVLMMTRVTIGSYDIKGVANCVKVPRDTRTNIDMVIKLHRKVTVQIQLLNRCPRRVDGSVLSGSLHLSKCPSFLCATVIKHPDRNNLER